MPQIVGKQAITAAAPNPAEASLSTHRYLALDALRGIAALSVVAFHSQPLFGTQIAPHAYLAVDFFFLLSGFVLTAAYQSKLDAGWSSADFLKLRFNRLYPLYLLGLLLGAFAAGLVDVHQTHEVSHGKFASDVLLGLLLFPDLLPVPFGMSFPLNFPTWSLFGEALANIVHTIFIRRRSLRVLILFAASAAVALVLCIQHLDTIDGGARQGDLYVIVPRVLFSYILGSILYRKWPSGLRLPAFSASLCAAALVLSFLLPNMAGTTRLYDFAVTFLIYPLILLFGAGTVVPPAFASFFRNLGAVSYAIYVLHIPLERLFVLAWVHFAQRTPDQFAPWSGILFVPIAIAVSLLADRFYDIPVRKYLRREPSRLP